MNSYLSPHVPYELPSGYESLTALRHSPSDTPIVDVSFSPNPAYEDYLKMHKVIVGNHGAMQLEQIYDTLSTEAMPRYLSVAGWAATEAALVRTDKSVKARMELLEGAVDCWSRAMETQQQFNDSGQNHLVVRAYPHRIALDIACAPLFGGVIQGEITKKVCREVFEDCLNIAQANADRLNLEVKIGDHDSTRQYAGLGYECNALLAFNKRLSPAWFAVPSTARSGNGYHHHQQTHDLQILHQRGGVIQSVTPVEIKADASTRDRNRYRALLVRGKMHLSVVDKYSPCDTLGAIAASYDGTATAEQRFIAESVGERLADMVKLYQAGAAIGDLATSRSLTVFHEGNKVSEKYPGILRAS